MVIDETGVLETIEGSTIVSAGMDSDGEGLHICLADGRVLVFIGIFTIGLVRVDRKKLH